MAEVAPKGQYFCLAAHDETEALALLKRIERWR
jgi:hypothetical protein